MCVLVRVLVADTSRGGQQCDTAEYKARCMHTPPNPIERCEGTHGYEAIDAEWMVDAGADCESRVCHWHHA